MYCCVAAGLSIGAILPAGAEDSAPLRAMFAQPPREYTTSPLWVWNDMLTEDEVIASLRDLASQGLRQVFVHPRPGLMTPYLSEDWFRLWKATLAEAEKLDMNVWIYDENSYPSGFAGGFVPEAMPESHGLGLDIHKAKQPGIADDNTLAVFKVDKAKVKDVTKAVRKGKDMPEGQYFVATLRKSKSSPWFGGKNYVDLLHPGVTQKFLEITLDAYAREIGGQFGKRMPGSFTDEPHLAPAGGLHWTPDLPEYFQKRWGYSLIGNLPGLVEEVGDWKRVRHDYFQSLLELFIERWAKPYYEYCAKHNIEFTGHYWEHEWPNCGSAPDNMAMQAWQQRPGIDILFNQYNEGCHAQFGNVRAVMELGSSSSQLGHTRTLCETYGGSGWDMRFEDLKRIGDWVSVLGVNTINEHLSHITLRGARKRDYPIVFSYHAFWWDAYHIMESYFTRLSAALSHGTRSYDTLILEPTTTVWMYQGTGEEQRNKVGDAFQRLVTACAQAPVEFDLGCEEIIADNGAVDGKSFVVGKCRYSTVVLPPFTENLNAKTWDLIEAFAKAGGKIISCSDTPPALLDGQPTERGKALAAAQGWKVVSADALPAAVQGAAFRIQRAEGDAGILYHQRRSMADGDLLFLVNTSIEKPAAGTIVAPAKSVEKWNLDSGTMAPYSWADSDQGIKAEFALPPCGSLLLFLSNKPGEKATPAPEAKPEVLAASAMQIARADANTLILDFMDVTAGGETKEGLLFKRAAEFLFQKNGLEHDPWDHAVQFGDELIKKTFPADSPFEATYRFNIDGAVPASLDIVIERPDLYTITCNGKPVSWDGKSWWLDRAFGKMNVRDAAVVGENKVTLKASQFTMFHELEPAYVLGDFALKATDKGFTIVGPQDLKVGSWKEQGLPLYGNRVTYTSEFKVAHISGTYSVALPDWYGAVAKITVNGKEAGYIYCKPNECDVTKLVIPGKNKIEVAVFGTPKNTLGPHHGNPPLGIASPGAFADVKDPGPPPGNEYSTIGYGLFAPFELRHCAAK